MTTLHYRRIRGDMIETYKIVTGKYETCVAPSLSKERTFIYLKSTTEGPEGHLHCRKNTETHKKTKKKQTNKRYNTENTTNQVTRKIICN